MTISSVSSVTGRICLILGHIEREVNTARVLHGRERMTCSDAARAAGRPGADVPCLTHTRHGPSNNSILNNTALAVIFYRGSNNLPLRCRAFRAPWHPHTADVDGAPRGGHTTGHDQIGWTNSRWFGTCSVYVTRGRCQ